MPDLQYWSEEELDLAFAEEVLRDPSSLYTCIQCGSCTASCPTANRMHETPQRLSRLVRLGLREEALAGESVWRCTSCNACSVHCPRGIPLLELLIGLKRHAVRRGLLVPEDVHLLSETVASSHNVSGDANEERLLWSRNLPQPLASLDREPGLDLAYFVGCIGSFYPRAFGIPQTFGRLLQLAGVRFTTLGGEEWCCGYPLYNAGLEDEVGALVEHNLEQIRALGVRRVVTTCPSCFYAWKHLWPRWAEMPRDLEIVHATQLLAELLEEGRLRPGRIDRVVTYHDPCDLGRKGGEFEAPRKILSLLPGVDFREMANIRSAALCCGGGGDVKIFSHDTTQDVARRRARQAVDIGADTVVSACQQCKRALLSAVQTMRQPIRVLDVTELVWESVMDQVEW